MRSVLPPTQELLYYTAVKDLERVAFRVQRCLEPEFPRDIVELQSKGAFNWFYGNLNASLRDEKLATAVLPTIR